VPGLAAAEIGNSFIIAYLISAILVIPSMLSQIELATLLVYVAGNFYFNFFITYFYAARIIAPS